MELLRNQYVVFAKNQYLETPRLHLRPVTLADARDMFDYARHEKTAQFVFQTHQTLTDTEEVIATQFLRKPLGKYGLELKHEGIMIGTIELKVNEVHGNGELGYTLHENYWGQGYMQEAGQKILQLGFEELQLIRIFAVHDSLNTRSGRVMEKLGMVQEACIPNARKWKGRITTDMMRGITVEAWQKLWHKT